MDPTKAMSIDEVKQYFSGIDEFIVIESEARSGESISISYTSEDEKSSMVIL